MKINTKKILSFVFVIILLLICNKVQAASASISATSTSATVGDSVTINVSINAAAWNLKVSGSGVSGGSIVGYDSDGNNKYSSQSYALNTSNPGTYTIYLSGDVTDGATDVNSSVSQSVTVTINAKPAVNPGGGESGGGTGGTSTGGGNSSSGGNTSSGGGNTSTGGNSGTNNRPTTTTEPQKSNDASLKRLLVDGYTLYPLFDSSIMEYNIKVTNDVTSISLIAACNHDKASYKVEGNLEDLQVGTNEFNIIVTAEDGTTNTYKLVVTREREALKVENITISYIDEEGNTKEIKLNPDFSEDIFKYSLEDLSYLISNLNIEVQTNLEHATVEIIGNENLVQGENIIKITVTMPSENEEEEDEILVYEISVNKEEEPTVTVIGKIKNWFNDLTGTIDSWFNKNSHNVITYSVIFCSICMLGLTVYLLIDYKKYKTLLEKVSELTKYNDTELQNAEQTSISTEDVDKQAEKTISNSKGRHF